MIKLLKHFKEMIDGLSEGLQMFKLYKRGKVR